jgi:endonuclease YncB( thermonuclease family)
MVVLTGVFLLLFSALSSADSVPYPGRMMGKLVSIESPITVTLQMQTWPGYFRSFTVTVPGIVVPEDTAGAPDCQRELAAKAMQFTQDYLADAKKIIAPDMRMKNSADQYAVAPILTEKGSLGEALIAEGLARPDSVDPTEPWCTD